MFRELQSYPRDSRLLLVTHKPFASRCIANLISMNSDSKISIKKASLSCVEVGSPVQRGAGVLRLAPHQRTNAIDEKIELFPVRSYDFSFPFIPKYFHQISLDFLHFF